MIASLSSERPGVVFIDFAFALFNRRRDDAPLLQLNYFLEKCVHWSFGGRKVEVKEIHSYYGLTGIGIPGSKSNLCTRSQA
jgi:hypothetical protein